LWKNRKFQGKFKIFDCVEKYLSLARPEKTIIFCFLLVV